MNLIRNATLGAAALVMSTLAISAASAASNTTAQQVAQNTAAPAEARPRRICVVDEASTGTRMPRRVCRTEREWIAEEGAVPGRE